MSPCTHTCNYGYLTFVSRSSTANLFCPFSDIIFRGWWSKDIPDLSTLYICASLFIKLFYKSVFFSIAKYSSILSSFTYVIHFNVCSRITLAKCQLTLTTHKLIITTTLSDSKQQLMYDTKFWGEKTLAK